MKDHELKVWPKYFEAICSGEKPFELRKNDRGFEVGDRLLLHEYNPETEAYTGRVAIRAISYVLQDEAWLQPGVCCLGIY